MPIPRSEPTRRRPAPSRRAAILALLEAAPAPLDVAALAAALGLHENTVRAHLAVLVRTGAATRETGPAGARGRPREHYSASGADPDGHAALARALADRLAAVAPDAPAEAVRAGRDWADRLAGDPDQPGGQPDDAASGDGGIAALVTVLDRLGFAPEVADDEIRLHACPFRRAALEHPEVVCNVHLGLIQRTLELAGRPGRAARLLPFVAPTLCVTDVSDVTDTTDTTHTTDITDTTDGTRVSGGPARAR